MKLLSLVFDDGPSYPICEIAEKIKSFGWSAGFAVIGRKINHETLSMLKYVIDNGFQVVTHAQNHVHIEKLSSREEMKYELSEPVKTVRQATGYEITMARLPFLSASEEVLSVAKELSLPLMGQGIDGGRDWDVTTPPGNIAKAVLGSVCEGAIGCLHVSVNTCSALDTILPELKARDFCLVTPEELFRRAGIPAPLGVQIHNINDFLG